VKTIYLDVSAADDPDLAGRLTHLADPEHQLVLVGPAGHPVAELPIWSSRTDALPEQPAAGSWYLTSDPAGCRDRQPDLRTILVGPRVDGQWPTRCDSTARDLREAVFEILSADAMQ
jgi:hypothetical protein